MLAAEISHRKFAAKYVEKNFAEFHQTRVLINHQLFHQHGLVYGDRSDAEFTLSWHSLKT